MLNIGYWLKENQYIISDFLSSMVEATVVDNDDGSFSVSYMPAEPGSYSVWVCVKAQHVKVQLLPVIHVCTPATSMYPDLANKQPFSCSAPA